IKETAACIWDDREMELVTTRDRHRLHWVDLTQGEDMHAAAAGQFKAPMPGAIREILAQPGDVLKQGAPVLIMEAMKMEHTLRAPVDGTLVALRCAVGDFVQDGDDLAEIEATTAGGE